MSMKRPAALLPLAAFIVFTAVEASASTPLPTAPRTQASEAGSQTQIVKSVPVAEGAAASTGPLKSHLFTVNDAKGLVLTCTAPELETNIDTDVFKSCTLAPGRTLDDVMHIFVQGIHFEQSQHAKERAEWQKDLEEKASEKPPEK